MTDGYMLEVNAGSQRVGTLGYDQAEDAFQFDYDPALLAQPYRRPRAARRKSWLFAGTLMTCQQATAFMSFIQSSKLNGHARLPQCLPEGRAGVPADAPGAGRRCTIAASLEHFSLTLITATCGDQRC